MSLSPLSSLYARILEARVRRKGPGCRLAHPVISVGNITMGGTGKTPFVAFLAAHFHSRGLRPAILSRGYGRSSRGTVLVSTGDGALVGADEGGDEPVELSRRLPGVVVAVARNRVDAAAEAVRQGANLFLLDDGFQHVAVARDVDLVLLDSGDPFGGRRFPPRGRLREPLSALRRADAFVFTHAEPGFPRASDLDTLARENARAPVFHARFNSESLVDENGAPLDARRIAREPFLAVCGIAAPASFRRSLAELGLDSSKILSFRDHQRYRDRHLEAIRRAARRVGASRVITTEKDAAKLRGRLQPLALSAVRRRVDVLEPGFFSFLESRLAIAGASPAASPAAR
ncbi:MAG TPA: tetraacyldisaccharide 4'-kinase [Thermoanaerobaculia bacterium]